MLFSPVFDKFQQRLGHQPALPRSNVLSVRLIQAIPFHTVTHCFARRPTPISFFFNHFRTLLTATEGVPSLHFDFAQFSYSLNPLESTLIEVPATVDSEPLAQSLSLLDATLTRNRGWGIRYAPRRRTQIRLVAGLPTCIVLPLERKVIVSSYSRFSTSTVVDGRRCSPSRNSRNCASFSYTQRISHASFARKSASSTAPCLRSCAIPPRIGTPCGQLLLSPNRFSRSASTSGEIACSSCSASS